MMRVWLTLQELSKQLFFAVFRPDFTIRISDRKTKLIQGVLPRHLVEEFATIVESQGANDGVIYGYRDAICLRLSFSPRIDRRHQQRFRNVLAAR